MVYWNFLWIHFAILFQSKRHHSSCADYLPDFLTICQEASKNLLLANKNEECLFLCNKVLTAFDCGFMSGIDMCEEDFPVISFLEREDMEARQETRTSCQRKRRLSADRQDTEQEQLTWKRMKNSALILACRADAEIMLGNCTAAVQDLTRWELSDLHLNSSSFPGNLTGWKNAFKSCYIGFRIFFTYYS